MKPSTNHQPTIRELCKVTYLFIRRNFCALIWLSCKNIFLCLLMMLCIELAMPQASIKMHSIPFFFKEIIQSLFVSYISTPGIKRVVDAIHRQLPLATDYGKLLWNIKDHGPIILCMLIQSWIIFLVRYLWTHAVFLMQSLGPHGGLIVCAIGGMVGFFMFSCLSMLIPSMVIEKPHLPLHLCWKFVQSNIGKWFQVIFFILLLVVCSIVVVGLCCVGLAMLLGWLSASLCLECSWMDSIPLISFLVVSITLLLVTYWLHIMVYTYMYEPFRAARWHDAPSERLTDEPSL